MREGILSVVALTILLVAGSPAEAAPKKHDRCEDLGAKSARKSKILDGGAEAFFCNGVDEVAVGGRAKTRLQTLLTARADGLNPVIPKVNLAAARSENEIMKQMNAEEGEDDEDYDDDDEEIDDEQDEDEPEPVQRQALARQRGASLLQVRWGIFGRKSAKSPSPAVKAFVKTKMPLRLDVNYFDATVVPLPVQTPTLATYCVSNSAELVIQLQRQEVGSRPAYKIAGMRVKRFVAHPFSMEVRVPPSLVRVPRGVEKFSFPLSTCANWLQKTRRNAVVIIAKVRTDVDATPRQLAQKIAWENVVSFVNRRPTRRMIAPWLQLRPFRREALHENRVPDPAAMLFAMDSLGLDVRLELRCQRHPHIEE